VPARTLMYGSSSVGQPFQYSCSCRCVVELGQNDVGDVRQPDFHRPLVDVDQLGLVGWAGHGHLVDDLVVLRVFPAGEVHQCAPGTAVVID